MSEGFGIIHLPVDVLRQLLSLLTAKDLGRLARCSKELHALTESLGWPLLAKQLSSPAPTLHRATRDWSSREHIRFSLALDKAWQEIDAALVQIGPTFAKKELPLLTLCSSRLVFATGAQLHVCGFDDRGRPFPELPAPEKMGQADVTGLLGIPDSNEAVVGSLTGSLQRIRVGSRIERLATYGAHASLREVRRAGAVQAVALWRKDVLAAVSTPRAGSRAPASTTEQGRLSVYALRSPWQPPATLSLNDRPWSLHLADRQIAVGSTGQDPLRIYDMESTGINGSSRMLRGPSFRSAVYAISSLPGESPQVMISGWYDGALRIHDLRQGGSAPALECQDKWSEDAIYSLAVHSSSRILAGTSRHSAIKIADLRSPASIHTTLYAGSDESPIYSLAVEASRVFAVTERRTIMIDFKPGAVENCWVKPPLWANGARPRYARAEEALRLRTFGEEDVFRPRRQRHA